MILIFQNLNRFMQTQGRLMRPFFFAKLMVAIHVIAILSDVEPSKSIQKFVQCLIRSRPPFLLKPGKSGVFPCLLF